MNKYSIGEIVYHPRNDEEVKILGIEEDGHYEVKTVRYSKLATPGLKATDEEMNHYIKENELVKLTKLQKVLE